MPLLPEIKQYTWVLGSFMQLYVQVLSMQDYLLVLGLIYIANHRLDFPIVIPFGSSNPIGSPEMNLSAYLVPRLAASFSSMSRYIS